MTALVPQPAPTAPATCIIRLGPGVDYTWPPLGSRLVAAVALGTGCTPLSRVDLRGVWPHSGEVRWRRVERAGWPTPEIAEFIELSGQLLSELLAVDGRHRPTLEDIELADRLAARVLTVRRVSQQQRPSVKHAA